MALKVPPKQTLAGDCGWVVKVGEGYTITVLTQVLAQLLIATFVVGFKGVTVRVIV